MKIASILAALALLLGRAAPATAFEFDTVMVGGRPAGDPAGPGLGAGIDWSTADRAAINEAGQVALQGRLLLQGGVTEANDAGIWRWENGALTLLSREGSQASGLPAGVTVATLSGAITVQIDDAGTILFRPQLGGTATTANDIAWTTVDASGTATLIAREGDLAPGAAPAIYGGNLAVRADNSGLAGSGKLAYRTTLTGPGISSSNDTAIYYGFPASPSLLIREGAPATDFGPTATFASPVAGLIATAGDQIVVANGVSGGSTSSVLLAGVPGSLAVVAQRGQAAPGIGGSFQSFSVPRINTSGDVLFNASADITPAVFLSDASGLGLVTAIGQPAPGTSETIFLSADVNGFQTALTESGDVAFYANLAPSASVNSANDSGLWVHDDGVTRLAVREGDAAPGLPGVDIGRIEHWTFNDREDLVFVSRLVGGVTAGVDDFALWLATADGAVTKILRTGESFDVDPSAGTDSRTISSLAVLGIPGFGIDHESNEMALTDNGQLLLNLGFSDGTSGVFVTNVVPEPSSLVLGALGVAALGLRRRR